MTLGLFIYFMAITLLISMSYYLPKKIAALPKGDPTDGVLILFGFIAFIYAIIYSVIWVFD